MGTLPIMITLAERATSELTRRLRHKDRHIARLRKLACGQAQRIHELREAIERRDRLIHTLITLLRAAEDQS